MKKAFSFLLSLVIVLSSLSISFSASAKDAYSNSNLSRVCVHDPSIVKGENGKYYVVGSHLAMAKSNDMINWSDMGYSLDGKNYLTTETKTWKENLAIPLEWTTKYQLAAGYDPNNLEYNCWANDIIYNKEMKKYCLYGCVSVWGTTASVIWLATSSNIEGPYEYVDSLVYSGVTSYGKKETDDPVIKALDYTGSNIPSLIDKGYIDEYKLNSTDTKIAYPWIDENGYYCCWLGQFPNAIDPTAFTDKNGEMWLVYGSYSGGCYLLKLDKATGLPDYDFMKKSSGYDVYFGKQISSTNFDTEGTGEGPFIIYDSVSDYYYFFLTYGGLAGDGGYNIREYRSKSPAGPYVDAAGNKATDWANTGLKLDGNYKFDCQPTAYVSGGHSSCLVDSDGSIYQAYHTRFTSDNGQGHQLRVHQMARTSNGWVVLLPFEYHGEKIKSSGISKSDIAGTYEFIDSTNMTQRKEAWDSPWSDIILPKQYIKLNSNGTISNIKDYSCSINKTNTGSQSVTGKWSLKNNSCYAEFKVGSVTYSGVFAYQKDESASAKNVLTFTAAGDDNSTVWGVKHTHSNKKIGTPPATTSQNGTIKYQCTLCGEQSSSTIYYPKTITLSTTSYTYNGKAKKPSVTVKDSKGKKIASSNYTVTYPSGRKNVGKYTVTIKFKSSNYSGTVKKTFTIKPKATSLSKLTAGKKKFTVKWKKLTTQTTGYQIQYATNSKFTKGKKTVTISKNKTTSKTISKLKAKKKYYVRIRTYKTVKGTKYYSSWSKAKSVKTK